MVFGLIFVGLLLFSFVNSVQAQEDDDFQIKVGQKSLFWAHEDIRYMTGGLLVGTSADGDVLRQSLIKTDVIRRAATFGGVVTDVNDTHATLATKGRFNLVHADRNTSRFFQNEGLVAGMPVNMTDLERNFGVTRLSGDFQDEIVIPVGHILPDLGGNNSNWIDRGIVTFERDNITVSLQMFTSVYNHYRFDEVLVNGTDGSPIGYAYHLNAYFAAVYLNPDNGLVVRFAEHYINGIGNWLPRMNGTIFWNATAEQIDAAPYHPENLTYQFAGFRTFEYHRVITRRAPGVVDRDLGMERSVDEPVTPPSAPNEFLTDDPEDSEIVSEEPDTPPADDSMIADPTTDVTTDTSPTETTETPIDTNEAAPASALVPFNFVSAVMATALVSVAMLVVKRR